MIVKYETEHYTFNYIKDSLAEKEIIEIACEQEKCFNKICDVLKIKYPRKISYWFYSSPEVLGEYLCEGNSCNGISITDDVCADIGKKYHWTEAVRIVLSFHRIQSMLFTMEKLNASVNMRTLT